MSIALPLPLRKSDAWGSFESVRTIPRGYGRVWSVPIMYNENARTYVWLDGVNGGVDSVTVDGQAVPFDWRNGVDSSGKPVTFLELLSAPTGEIVASGLGQVGANGNLIDNPADVIADILSLYGKSADLSLFKAEAARRGVKASGLLSGSVTGRAAISQVCESIGARWSSAARGFAFFYPSDPPASIVHSIDTRGAVSEWQIDRVVSVVRVLYDYDHEGPRRVLQYRAPWWVGQVGERVREIEARFIRSPRDAQALGLAEISRYGRHVQRIVQTTDKEVREGEWVTLTDGFYTGSAFVTGVTRNLRTGRRTLTMELAQGSAPTVTLEPLATKFDPSPTLPIVASLPQGVAVYAQDAEVDPPQPLPGAKVTHVASGAQRTADGQGRVIFPHHLLPAGSEQTFLFEHEDYQPSTLTVTI